MKISQFERYRGVFGVYAFYEDDVCIYVGKATCVYSRVKGHKTRFVGYTRFAVYDLGDYIVGMDYANAHWFLCIMEAYMIKALVPVENIKRPNLARMLRPKFGASMVDAFRKAYEIIGGELWPARASTSAHPSRSG